MRHLAFEEQLLARIRVKCRTGRASAGLRRRIEQLIEQL
jgi:hypothetical protein